LHLDILALPSIDGHWRHDPSHFWIVIGAAVLAAALGWSVGTSARRRSDARLVLVSMSFVAAAAFFGLHAIATPRVLISHPNDGFVVAVPVGLAVATVFALWSAIPLEGARAMGDRPYHWYAGHAVGSCGDGRERAYNVLGDTVNVAAHIEALAADGSVVISDATYRAVPGARVTSLGTVTLKSRAEPLRIWGLDGLE
jgi:class 3 adenylate cyclase